MKPITRIEQLLSGMELTPITRLESYIANLNGQNVITPSPVTREEQILSGTELKPITRLEMFMMYGMGMLDSVPEPITREEWFWKNWSGGEPKEYEVYVSGILPLELKNSLGKDLVDWSIVGDTVQNGTPSPENPIEVKGVGDRTGNLLAFPYDVMERTSYGAKLVCDENQVIHAEGTPIKLIKLQLLINCNIYETEMSAGENLYLSWITTNDNLCAQITVKNINNVIILDKQDVGAFVMPIDAYYVSVSVISKSAKVSIDGEIKVMLNEGSEPLPYEPYGVKIPVVSRGKNLCPPLTIGKGLNNTTGVEVVNPNAAVSDFIPVNFDSIPEYTCSNLVPTLHAFVAYYDENKVFIKRGAGNQYNYTQVRKTIAPNAKYIRITQYVAGTEVFSDFKNEIMITEGSDVKPYEPYRQPIISTQYLPTPLMANERLTPTAREVKWRKYEITGNEIWSKHATLTGWYQFQSSELLNDPLISIAFCTHFKWDDSPITSKGYFTMRSTNENQHRIVIRGDYLSEDDLISFLKSEYDAGHPVTVWYQLATPTTEPVETTPIGTLDGDCWIDTDTEIEPVSMSATYKSSKPDNDMQSLMELFKEV